MAVKNSNAALPEIVSVLPKEQQFAADAPELREFFIFWCPHCRELQPALRQMRGFLEWKVPVFVNLVPWSDDMRFTEQALAAAMTSQLTEKPIKVYQEEIDRLTDAVFREFYKTQEHTENLALSFEGISALYQKIIGEEMPKELTPEQRRLINLWHQKGRNIETVPQLIINGRCQISAEAVIADPYAAAKAVITASQHRDCLPSPQHQQEKFE